VCVCERVCVCVCVRVCECGASGLKSCHVAISGHWFLPLLFGGGAAAHTKLPRPQLCVCVRACVCVWCVCALWGPPAAWPELGLGGDLRERFESFTIDCPPAAAHARSCPCATAARGFVRPWVCLTRAGHC